MSQGAAAAGERSLCHRGNVYFLLKLNLKLVSDHPESGRSEELPDTGSKTISSTSFLHRTIVCLPLASSLSLPPPPPQRGAPQSRSDMGERSPQCRWPLQGDASASARPCVREQRRTTGQVSKLVDWPSQCSSCRSPFRLHR